MHGKQHYFIEFSFLVYLCFLGAPLQRRASFFIAISSLTKRYDYIIGNNLPQNYKNGNFGPKLADKKQTR